MNWQHAVIYLKGLCMGAADIIPGVSGGTIALITGIYQRLIDGIAHIANIFYPRELDFKILRKKILKIDYALFIPLILGIATAFLLLSNVIHYLLTKHIAATYSFFFGLIIASAAVLYRKLDKFTLQIGLFSLAGAAAGYALTGLGKTSASHSLPVLFGSGAIAITAMILPGISGAFILLLLNQYDHVINMIRTFSIVEIIVFVLGAGFGLLIFSELLHYLLRKHEGLTMGFLIGLMIGSLRLPVMIIAEEGFVLGKVLLFFAIGFLLVFGLEKLGSGNT